MAARKTTTKKTVEKKVEEQQPQVQDLTTQKNKRIIPNVDTEMRKFPTLQQAHIVGTAKKGQMYEVVSTIGGVYGWFYKLSNGCYVVKEGNYKTI